MDDFSMNDNIIYGLIEDFECIIYADLDSDSVSEARSCTEFSRALEGCDDPASYDKRISSYSESLIYTPDAEKFRKLMSRHNLRQELAYRDVFFSNIRLVMKNSIQYYQIKVVRNQNDTVNTGGVVIGFHNVDEITRNEIRQREKIESLLKRESVYRKAICSDSCGYYEINLTHDLLIGDAYELRNGYENSISEELGSLNFSSFSELVENYIRTRLLSNEKEFRDIVSCKALISKYYNGELMPSIDFWARAIDSSRICYRQTFFLYKSDYSDEISAFVVLKDITNEQLLNESLKEGIEQAQGASKAKSTFLFNMSHDIRTPMNAIIGFAGMAKKYLNDAPRRAAECLDNVEIAGNQLLCLINDVLDMASIESGKIVIDESPANITTIVNNLVKIITPSCNDKKITLRNNFSFIEHEDVYIDVPHFNRIILNLLNNAVKYTKNGGEITFSAVEIPCEREGHAKYKFIVSDNGIGISKDFIDNIFDSFSRERTSTTSGIEGTGLGLSIVKGLLDMMGGDIQIESTPGSGTTVNIELMVRLSAEQTSSGEDTDIDKINISGVHVLLVEDNEMNRQIAKDILESLGVIITEAEDGYVAVDLVRNSKPGDYDIILMDIQMPIMNGYTATHEIRNLEEPTLAKIPIIAMTANAFEEDKRRALSSGMDAHLAKPIDVPCMIRTIARFTGRNI